MASSTRPARLGIAVAGALLLAYILIWAQLSAAQIAHSDFTSSYVGGLLLRQSGGATVYDPATQTATRDQLIAPVHNGGVPFVDSPPAAALMVPLTYLGLDAAYRVWSLLAIAILVLAVVIAVRAAPWPPDTPPVWKAAAATAGLASTGTWMLLIQGQWSSLTALALALALREWRHERRGRGALLLVVGCGLAKPHLALGLGAFLIGWRDRRILAGALTGVIGLGVASVALVGPGGVAAFARLASAQTGAWILRRMLSFIALPGSYFGNGTVSQVIGLVGTVTACATALWLGTLVRRRGSGIVAPLLAAAVLSLAGAPHAYAQDLVMLAPVLVWSLAIAPGRRTQILSAWTLLTAAAFLDFADLGVFPPGPIAPLVLVGIAVAACVAAARHPLTSPDREAAMGPVADDLRQRGRVLAG